MIWGSRYSPSTPWVPGIKLRFAGFWRCLCPLSYLASPEFMFRFQGEIVGGGDGSVSSVLATQAGEPELNPQHHVNSSTEVECAGLCF